MRGGSAAWKELIVRSVSSQIRHNADIDAHRGLSTIHWVRNVCMHFGRYLGISSLVDVNIGGVIRTLLCVKQGTYVYIVGSNV